MAILSKQLNQALFKNPEYSCVQVSPAASYFSYLQDINNTTSLILQIHNTQAKIMTMTTTENRISEYWWSACEQYIIFLEDKPGQGSVLVYLDIKAQKTIDIVSKKMIKSVVCSVQNPKKVYIEMKDYTESYFHLYEYDTSTQALKVKYHNNQYAEIIYNQKGEVLYAILFVKHHAKLVQVGEKTQKYLFDFTQHDILSYHRFSHLKPKIMGDKLYVLSSKDTDTLALFCLSTQNGEIKKIPSHNNMDQADKGDIEQVVWEFNSCQPVAYYRAYQRRKHYGLNHNIQEHLTHVQKYIKNHQDFVICSQDYSNQHWIICIHSDQAPPQYIHYDLKHQKFKTICFESNSIEHTELYNTHCIDIPTRDNKTFPAFFTPTKVKMAPLVILIHGGPHSREFWGWLPVHQWLAHLGFHSLSVNYRGSVGMGRSHLEMANGEWAGCILDDIHDARTWAIAQGHTQADKVALFGNSFGGYATMMSLLKTPDDFVCGVDQMGPSNLVELIQQLPPGWQVNQALINQILALDIASESGKAHALKISPVSHLHKLKKPLLMGYGAWDPIVHPNQARNVVNILKDNHVPVACFMFEKQGHQILDSDIRASWLEYVGLFLSRQLLNSKKSKPIAISLQISVMADDFKLVTDP